MYERWQKTGFSLSIAQVIGDDGKINGTVVLIRDETKRKKIETDLIKSEKKIRAFLESNPDPVTLYDMDVKVKYLNPAFTRTFR